MRRRNKFLRNTATVEVISRSFRSRPSQRARQPKRRCPRSPRSSTKLRPKILQLRLTDYAQTKDEVFLTDDGRTTYALVFAPPPVDFTTPLPSEAIQPILDQASANSDITWQLTSYDMLAAGNSSESAPPSVLAETLAGCSRRTSRPDLLCSHPFLRWCHLSLQRYRFSPLSPSCCS